MAPGLARGNICARRAEVDRTEKVAFLECVRAHPQLVSGADLGLKLVLLRASVGLKLPTVTQTYQLYLKDLQI